MKRKKNSILAAIEVFRDVHPNLTPTDLRVFVAVARGQRELISIARNTGVRKETVSRCARSFLSERSALALSPSADLLSVEVSRRNNRTRMFILNSNGEAVRGGINSFIAEGRPIQVMGPNPDPDSRSSDRRVEGAGEHPEFQP